MLGSEQPKVLAEFYEKVLGRKPDMSEDGKWYGWMVQSAFLGIGAHSEVHGQSKEPARIMFTFQTKEVKEEFERIKATGATVIKEPYTMPEGPQMWIATFTDPDGNYFQLMSPWEEGKK